MTRMIDLIADATPEFRDKLSQALATTTRYIMGCRDGSCYRYEQEIEDARQEFHISFNKTEK